MSFNELRLFLYNVFENRIIMEEFRTIDLMHFKKCICTELRKRGL